MPALCISLIMRRLVRGTGAFAIKHGKMVFNTALLTGSSLLMSCIGMAFQVWLAGRIGAAGIGLFQLVSSVTNLGATFAISGIRFASTRLVAEELGADNVCGIRSAMRRCMLYGAFFGTAAALILWELAEPLGFLWIGDARTVLSLRISALSMPCISLCSSVSGYFTACGRVWKPTLVHLIEQLCGIAFVAVFLSKVPVGEIEKSCAAVTLGRLAADLISLALMLLMYCFDRRRHYLDCTGGQRLTGRMLKIALPLAVSAYTRSALSTIQHLLVPRGLKAAGYSSDGALAGYGIIQGMVLPVILFPSCIMYAAAELIVPELTAAQVQGNTGETRALTSKLLRLSFVFSMSAAAFIFIFADMLGLSIYESSEAGRYIRILAPLIPIMYMDIAVDGCLKGHGEQLWCMGVNIVDSLSSLILVWLFIPRYALSAYLAVIYFTETLNFVLSLYRLRKIWKQSALQGARRPCGAEEKCAYKAGT